MGGFFGRRLAKVLQKVLREQIYAPRQYEQQCKKSKSPCRAPKRPPPIDRTSRPCRYLGGGGQRIGLAGRLVLRRIVGGHKGLAKQRVDVVRLKRPYGRGVRHGLALVFRGGSERARETIFALPSLLDKVPKERLHSRPHPLRMKLYTQERAILAFYGFDDTVRSRGCHAERSAYLSDSLHMACVHNQRARV